jgi:hypothetical protein
MAEIRCYGKPRVANGLVLVIAAGLSLMVGSGLLEGNYTAALAVAAIGYFAVSLVWIGSRHGTFIAVDPDTKTLRASNFFIRTRPIPIDSITRIGTRGMFVGAVTEIEITYRESDGRRKTVGYGTKSFLDRKDLKRVFDALVAINPSLRVPNELAGDHSSY